RIVGSKLDGFRRGGATSPWGIEGVDWLSKSGKSAGADSFAVGRECHGSDICGAPIFDHEMPGGAGATSGCSAGAGGSLTIGGASAGGGSKTVVANPAAPGCGTPGG